ncbi:MAG: HAD hydrolase-like protein [Deltaproteobacteria bacterium]|nr:HAD hydrolase-like protein [Deltaproteobacteria bacterium]
MSRFTAIFFDLDGTLIDPGEGIANTIQFVLDSLDVAYPFDGSVWWYVGPPLSEIFGRVLPLDSGAEPIERAVSLYIERFATHGALKSVVYQGITEVLVELRVSARLFLVTAKNTAVAEQILTAHMLRHHFDGVIGTERDSRFANKADAVHFILKQANLNPETTAIVGDRMHDMTAGKSNGIFTVGVTYGYGTKRELISAGADRICKTPRELLQFLRKEVAVEPPCESLRCTRR